jgi:hypothetical protein
MKTVVVAMLAMAGTASADIQGGSLLATAHFNLGETGGTGASRQQTAYDNNSAGFQGNAFANGGGAGGITRLVADDITPIGPRREVDLFSFSVANLNTVPVSVRPRVRFWFTDGAGGGPGTYYNDSAAIGFTFNPITINPGVTILTADLAAGNGFFIGGGVSFWAGVTYDNVGTTLGTTPAQLANMGVGLFGAPVSGSSADALFQTNADGSFFNVPNPAGVIANFGGAPIANTGWAFDVVPAPASASLLAFGALAAARRRR